MTNYDNLHYIHELGYGYWKSQVLFVAVEMDVFTQIGVGGKSGKDIASELETHPRSTEMLLNVLVSLGFLKKVKGIYKNTPLSKRYLVKGEPLYQGDRIHHFHNLWEPWSRLSDAVRSGKPTAFEDVQEGVDEHRLRDFLKSMHNMASIQVEEVCRKLKIDEYRNLLDLGGGLGTYALRFAKENSDLRATIFDLPDVIKITDEYIRESGLTERVTTQGGNCLKDGFGRERFDIIFVSNLLHGYKPAENRSILKKCWYSLMKKGIVVIQEFALNTGKTSPTFGTLFGLNMLVGTLGGAMYSGDEIKEWLIKVGFKKIKKIDINKDSHVIIGYKMNCV
ncbi:MAG: acetylserotonin O-methyltransferase [Candidatus Scalindua sp.]|nr:acetylserotonin O-methyltransferase [Candidatus Scalindua sp.]